MGEEIIRIDLNGVNSYLIKSNGSFVLVDTGGRGGQTMILAEHLTGTITALDLFPEFIDVLNGHANKQKLGERVKGIVGSMDDLPFERESFDLIWSEGAIDNIGFKKGLTHWNGFLKKNGYVVVTCPSWLTKGH